MPYVFYTHNNDSNIKSSDDDDSNTVPELQDWNSVDSSSDKGDSSNSIKSSDDDTSSTLSGLQHHSGCCSDGIPQSIDTHSCVPSWTNAIVDEDDYDADHDDDAGSIASLQMRGDGTGLPPLQKVATSKAGLPLPQYCSGTNVASSNSRLPSLQYVPASKAVPLLHQLYAGTEVASYNSHLPSLQKVAASKTGPLLHSCQKVVTNTLSKLIDFESYNKRVYNCM